MNSFALLALVAATTVFALWYAWRLASIVKADGHGSRASSGLPRDWAPADLPSTPYIAKPHF